MELIPAWTFYWWKLTFYTDRLYLCNELEDTQEYFPDNTDVEETTTLWDFDIASTISTSTSLIDDVIFGCLGGPMPSVKGVDSFRDLPQRDERMFE